MACLVKHVIRFGVIGALATGAAVVIAGPARVNALFTQARSSINTCIDGTIQDPIALRSQLRDLESKYPARIAEVSGDLAELREQKTQLERELARSERVVAITDRDLDSLESALAKADDAQIRAASMEDEGYRVVVVFKNERLEVGEAAGRVNQITATRNAYAARATDIQRDLGYLEQQEGRLAALLTKLETERASFQAELWQLDRQVDTIARNDRMIEIMQRRERTLTEQDRYTAVSLDHVKSGFAERLAAQESKLAALAANSERTDYESQAQAELDRELGVGTPAARRTSAPASPRKAKVIEVRPDCDGETAPPDCESDELAAKVERR